MYLYPRKSKFPSHPSSYFFSIYRLLFCCALLPPNPLHFLRVTIQVIQNDSRWGYAKVHRKEQLTWIKERMAELEKIEAHGAENGWVAPMTEEDREFFAYFSLGV